MTVDPDSGREGDLSDKSLPELRRLAFSRHGTPEQLKALRELEARSKAPAPPPDDVPVLVDVAPPPRAVTPSPRPPRRIDALRSHWGLVVAGVVAALVIAAVGFSVGRAAHPPTPVVTDAAVAGADSQRGTATLALLDTAQQPRDIPPFALGSDIISSTVHRIGSHLPPDVTVYGAISQEKEICLVAITADLQSAQTCVTQHVFVTDGIRLRLTTRDTVVDDAGFDQRAFYQYYWSSDGSISGSSNRFLFPDSPHR